MFDILDLLSAALRFSGSNLLPFFLFLDARHVPGVIVKGISMSEVLQSGGELRPNAPKLRNVVGVSADTLQIMRSLVAFVAKRNQVMRFRVPKIGRVKNMMLVNPEVRPAAQTGRPIQLKGVLLDVLPFLRSQKLFVLVIHLLLLR